MGRSAFLARREGRYVFRTRRPPCLMQGARSASIRIALQTADYTVAVRRTAKIASWMLRMKTAESLEEAIRNLFPKLQEVALRPVIDQDDFVERSALQLTALEILSFTHRVGIDADKVVPGWTEHYLALLHENGRASSVLEKTNSVAGRLEFQRHQMMREGRPPVVTPDLHPDPQAQFLHSSVFPAMTAGAQKEPQKQNASAGALRLSMSQVLQRYLVQREQKDGDRRAESDAAPIIKFAIELLDDPVMFDLTGDDILKLKKAIPEIPTRFGFPREVADDLHHRWKHVSEHGWEFERDGKVLRYKRTSRTTIDGGWTLALVSLWEMAIEHRFASSPIPNFELSTPKNPVAVERDAFRFEELIKFFSAAAFGASAGRTRLWTVGKFFYQGFFYWAELICLLCGMRPGEIAQLRCRDILDLYGWPHFRFARFGVEQEEEARLVPQQGGNDGKTSAAFRWIPIHWLLLRLGIIDRRNAIVADYISRNIEAAGGRGKLLDEQISAIERAAAEQWLFPDWPVYVKKTDEIKWSHVVSKAFRYGLSKLGMQRLGLSQYSARHTFKGFIDAVRGLSERSRKVIMGHSTKGDVTTGYGPKFITEEQSEVVQGLSSRQIWRLALILIRAKRRAETGELVVVDSWRNDERSKDEKFQAALARRAELYR